MTTSNYFKIVWHNIFVFIIVILVTVGVTLAFSLNEKASYQTSVVFTVQEASTSKTSDTGDEAYYSMQIQKYFARNLEEWIKIPATVQEGNKIAGNSALNTLEIKKSTTNNIQVVFATKDKDQIDNAILALGNILEEKTQELNRTNKDELNFAITSAKPSTSENTPNLILNLLIGFCAGILLALAAAFGLDLLFDKLHTKKDAERLFKTKSTTTIPSSINKSSPWSEEIADQFRTIRAQLLHATSNKKLIALVANSTAPASSAISLNLALSFARAGVKTLLIDADLKNPSLHEHFDCLNKKGLSEVLKSPGSFKNAIQKTKEENLSLLPTGKKLAYPADTIAEADLEKLFTSIKKNYQAIIIHATPLDESDALPLLDYTKTILLVTEINKSTNKSVTKAKNLLKNYTIKKFLAVIE
ncbi:polysaccharide biosynthesis tyrosine autokinase [Patescibacteria group bacterium]